MTNPEEEKFQKCRVCREEFFGHPRVAKKHLLYKCREGYPDNLEVHQILDTIKNKFEYVKPQPEQCKKIRIRSNLF